MSERPPMDLPCTIMLGTVRLGVSAPYTYTHSPCSQLGELALQLFATLMYVELNDDRRRRYGKLLGENLLGAPAVRTVSLAKDDN